MLQECVRSVKAQTDIRWEHLWLLDEERVGCAQTLNELARHATGDWILPLADDDLLLPGFLKAHLGVEADFVYSPPLVDGEDPRQFHGEPPNIPSTCLIRREAWDRLGGYDEKLWETEDCDLYTRAMEKHMTFERVDGSYWLYRFHGKNKSRGNG